MATPLSTEHASQVAALIQRCREAGLRRTALLDIVLRILTENTQPLTTNELVEREEVKNQCDPATVYRLLTRLEENGLLRRLGLRDRSAHYVLRQQHSHDDYLVCTECGTIEQLDMECPVSSMEKAIAKQSGFRNLEHELEFFGVCPDCHDGITR